MERKITEFVAVALLAISVAALSLFVVGCANDDDDDDDDTPSVTSIVTYKCKDVELAKGSFNTDEVLAGAFVLSDSTVMSALGASAKITRAMDFYSDKTWTIHSTYKFEYNGATCSISADYSGNYWGEPSFVSQKGKINVQPKHKSFVLTINTGKKTVVDELSYDMVTLEKTGTGGNLTITDLILPTNTLSCKLVIDENS